MRYLSAIGVATLVSVSLAQDQLTVQTQQGAVNGALVTPGVRRFLGIPYAVANRWEAPQAPPTRTTTFIATSYGSTCVQQLSASNRMFLKIIGLGGQVVQESENCLNVNIWAPSSSRKQGTAVMIWIHGGGFEFGTSNTIFYDGQPMVANNDDVLVITVEYRTSIFGFPNAPQLSGGSQSQNFGALDVEAAIQWVHSNIAAFGGDPNRITLFGQSAGAGLISAYTFSHPTDTIVKGVIEESGSLAGMASAITTFGRPLSTTGWDAVGNAVGCGTASTSAQLACMKAVPAGTLLTAVVQSQDDFVPVQDGITFFTDASARSAAGNFLHVPILVGNTGQEGDIFVLQIEQLNPSFNFPGFISQGGDLLTEIAFTCPAGITAGDYVHAGVPAWRYRYEGVFPDISSNASLRSFHASEIPIVFGTFSQSTFGPPPSDSEKSLSKYVQGAWVAFARDPQGGLTNYGFPLYNAQTATLAQLGNSANQSGVVFAQGNAFDGNCLLDLTTLLLLEEMLTQLGVMF